MECLAILLLEPSAVALKRGFDIAVFRSRSHLLACLAMFLVVGVAWDSFAVWSGHWTFGEATYSASGSARCPPRSTCPSSSSLSR